MTNSAVSQAQGNTQIVTLAKDTAIALIIQASGLALVYLLQISLAQWMGKTEYGIYEYIMSWSLLLAILAGLGLPRTILRLIPQYRVKNDWGRLHGIFRGSWVLTVLASCLLACIAAFALTVINDYHPFVYAVPLIYGMGLVLLQALATLQQESARAMEDIPLAFIPSQIILPVLILCSGFLLWHRNGVLTSLRMIDVATVMFLVVLGFQFALLWQKINRNFVSATPVYAYKEWLAVALVLLIQQASSQLLSQTDTVMIGSFMGPESTGVYNAAVKTSVWTSFVLQVVNMVAAPMFSSLYAQGNLLGLQRLVSCVTLWIFYPTIAIAFGLMILAQPILGLFGPGFIAASWSLKILILGQLVNALCGSVGYLMIMTGHQNKSFKVIGCSALLNLGLNAILIPLFGIVGAAIATSFSMMVWNIWLTHLVVKHVGVRPSIFYSLFQRDANSTPPTSEPS
ncbi:flippase [Aetokthonos hydrillicola Thurmond2011]|jgi:O-antigen/teichoic acid export membrane protein|uniref:Flippase n=2 Tax=Aetokthonos TaxID=1550243 RepID=A0AAP5IAY8_9CYAN|nr:flippase [Aetokthonos hydrillicola]MBW4589867.1 flippase [Aetokthonos hydrillicola CCALA 1050]MDR9896949.1 flippase [Aetokthonos hydrillicola Thurmond2011]